MVKVKNRFGDEYKGRQGQAVYQGFYGRQVRRLWDGPKRNTAPAQEKQKLRFRIGLSFWAGLTGEQKRFLREYVSTHYAGLTAQQWAVKVALSRPRAVLSAEQVKANVVEWKEGWDAIGWPYRQAVTITNNTSDDLNDYQQEIDLTADSVGDNFRWDLKGADLRFYTADGQKIPYWVESWDEDNKKAVIWVRIGSLKANSSTSIKMYYGNADAESESDGSAVFDFFDDFNGDSIDTNKWIIGDATGLAVTNSTLRVTNTEGYIRSKWTVQELDKYIIETRTKIISYAENGFTAVGTRDDSGDGYYSLMPHSGATYDTSNGGEGKVSSSTEKAGEWYKNIAIYYTGKTHYKGVEESTGSVWLEYDRSRTVYTDERIQLGRRADMNYSGQSCEIYYDWVRVRKYTSSEPSAALGQEEEGRYYVEGVKTIYVKAVEHVAVKKVELYDEQGQLLGTWDDLSNLEDGRVTTIWRIPDDVADAVASAVVHSLAGTVDQVSF